MAACPGGHHLPHRGATAFCTITKCGGEGGAKGKLPARGKSIPKRQTTKPQGPATLPPPPRAASPASPASAIERGRPVDLDPVAMMAARAKVRQALVPTEVVAHEDVESWTQKKAVSLLPGAMAEVEYQMRFGDDKQRIDAARDVLDMTGNRKRDALGGGGNTIILNLSQGDLPWLKRAVADAPLPVLAPTSALADDETEGDDA